LLKLDSWKTSNVKVEMEMIPDSLLMNNAKADLINTTSASGNVNKKLDEIEVKVDLNKANLEVENFFGTIELKDKLKLSGTATNIEINGKKI
jgi:TATA-box binding protein (TBP) (component of TFIID and TFIIIB)